MATLRRYASGTTIAVEKSVAAIQRLVKQHGGRAWRYEERDDQEPPSSRISFVLDGLPIRFSVDAPDRADLEISPAGRYRTEHQIRAAREAEVRRRWREIALLVRAKLVAVAAGIVDVQEEFLSTTVLSDDETVAEYMLPRLAELQAQQTVRLLPPAIVEETP
jgi:hypothetical protein